MGTLRENKNGYASKSQREVLIELVSNPVIQESFFLTGGTALSVFYLGHRISEDLDLFTIGSQDLSEIDFWIKTQWPGESVKIKESPRFLSLLIRDVKVDLVIDPLSIQEERDKIFFENESSLRIDTLSNIVTNKFCAIVSRTEPKDFIDFYLTLQVFPNFEASDLYQRSRQKDAIFDDPPTVAYQIENGISFIIENPSLWPETFLPIDRQDFFEFYKKLVMWIYGLINPGQL